MIKSWKARLLTYDEYSCFKAEYALIGEPSASCQQYFLLEREDINGGLILCQDDIGLTEVHSIVFDDYSLIFSTSFCYAVNDEFCLLFEKPLTTPCMGIECIRGKFYAVCELELLELYKSSLISVCSFSDQAIDYTVCDDSITVELFDGTKIQAI